MPILDSKELTDQIYDTLMGNVGFSVNHVPFDLDRVTAQEVNASEGVIYFEIDHIDVYKLQLTKARQDYFREQGYE